MWQRYCVHSYLLSHIHGLISIHLSCLPSHLCTLLYVPFHKQVVENAQTDQNKLAEIIRTCRAVVAAEHGLMLSSVVLLRTRTVPKTTSGKIARAWCRKAYVDGTLSALTRWDGGEAGTVDNSPSPSPSPSQILPPPPPSFPHDFSPIPLPLYTPLLLHCSKKCAIVMTTVLHTHAMIYTSTRPLQCNAQM